MQSIEQIQAHEDAMSRARGFLNVDDELAHILRTPLICRRRVREFLLETAKQLRPFNKFSRVSEDTLMQANAQLRAFLVSHVKRMPSKGRTL